MSRPGSSQVPDQDAGDRGEFSRLAVGGVFWQGLAFMLGRGFTLVATVVLARLLTPDDFGLVALALVFITFAEYASDLGVSQALVYLPRKPRTSDAALAISIASGAVLCAAGVAAAPLVAGFFDEPEVAPMFQVLSGALLIGAVRQVPDALLRRELLFRKRATAEVSRAVAQGVVSIVLAAGGLGAWAIVWGYVAGSVAWCVAAWLLAGYRPSRQFWRVTGSDVRPLFGFGAPAAAQGLLASLIFDIDYVIVGKMLGSEALGSYTLAFRLPQLLIINVFFVLSAVAFPMFSRAREERGRLERGYLTSVRLQATYGVAAGVGLFLTAPLVVPVVFGDKWDAAIAPLEGLALYAAFRSLGAGAVDVYKGIGRPGLAAAVALGRFAVLVPALLVAAQYGIAEVAWTQAGLALAFAAGMQGVACRVVGLSLTQLVRALRPALIVAAGIILGTGPAVWWLPGPEGLRLAIALVGGAAAGFAALWIAAPEFLRDTRALLTRRKRPPAVVTA
jgi:lipopolysaccharide exporter